MSDIRFNRWLHQSGTGGIHQDSSGNIGIGTSVPTVKVDIQGGDLKVGDQIFSSSGVSTFSSGLNVTGGKVGIGTDDPKAGLPTTVGLHVYTGASGQTGTNSANLIIEDGDDAEIVLLCPSTNVGRIKFGDNDHANRGQIRYDHTDDSMQFTVSGNNEKLRITSGGDVNVAAGGSVFIGNGNLVFSTAGTGIDFSATDDGSGTTTSELLDDYEEGTWTPTSETGTIVSTSAKYTKIGNIVHINAYIDDWSDITSDTQVQIQSLPYAGENTDANVGSVMYRYINDTDGIGGDLALFMANGNSLRFYFQNSVGDSNYAALKHKDINGTTSSFRIQMTYRAA